MSDRTCSIESCDRAYLAHDLCSMHYQRAYRAAHQEQSAVYNKRAREKDPQYHRDRVREWHRKNPEYKRQSEARRRAVKHATRVTTYHLPVELLHAKVAYWGDRCWVCRGVWTEYDHHKPLSKGGCHLVANIRPICRSCNASKKDRWPLTDWLAKRITTTSPIAM